MNEDFLQEKIGLRKAQGAYRQLVASSRGIDFCSNDYLGMVKNNLLQPAEQYSSGSTGSRLLTGNNQLLQDTEQMTARFHQAEAALIFNSGYDANLGLFSCVPQRGDTVLYDYLSHASIRDGIRLGLAHSFSFLHNDLADLEKKLAAAKGRIFVVTESVFSMDGDTAPLPAIAALCERYQAHLVVDEAHATGIAGTSGEGWVQAMGLQQQCFARVHTFGKALGCHGAVILGSYALREYLINFCRSLIYTTALPPAAIAAIRAAYAIFPKLMQERAHVQELISRFQSMPMGYTRLPSLSPVQSVIIPGNVQVQAAAEICRQNGFDIRPIRYPTVPKDSERLRIVLHAFNSHRELERLAALLGGQA